MQACREVDAQAGFVTLAPGARPPRLFAQSRFGKAAIVRPEEPPVGRHDIFCRRLSPLFSGGFYFAEG